MICSDNKEPCNASHTRLDISTRHGDRTLTCLLPRASDCLQVMHTIQQRCKSRHDPPPPASDTADKHKDKAQPCLRGDVSNNAVEEEIKNSYAQPSSVSGPYQQFLEPMCIGNSPVSCTKTASGKMKLKLPLSAKTKKNDAISSKASEHQVSHTQVVSLEEKMLMLYYVHAGD